MKPTKPKKPKALKVKFDEAILPAQQILEEMIEDLSDAAVDLGYNQTEESEAKFEEAYVKLLNLVRYLKISS